MSLFEYLVLGILGLLVLLGIVGICVGTRAARNARDAKTEAERKRPIMQHTCIDPAAVQSAVEQVLHDTGALQSIFDSAQPPAITAGDAAYHNGDHRHIVPATQASANGGFYAPGHPLHGYQEVPPPESPRDRFQAASQNEGRGRFFQGPPFSNSADRPALGMVRDPLGIQAVTDTQVGIPAFREEDASGAGYLADPDADVATLERRLHEDTETTRDWSLAWQKVSSGQQPPDEAPPQNGSTGPTAPQPQVAVQADQGRR